MKKYSAAVIGCGSIGIDEDQFRSLIRPGTHAGGFSSHPKTFLSALVDIETAKLKQARKYYPKIASFLSCVEMMKKVKPDIVSVATNTNNHLEVVSKIAKMGPKVIVCEKPISMSISEAKTIINICKKNYVKLFVNHSRLFDKSIRELDLKIKTIGPVVSGNAYLTRGIYNGGTHLVSLLLFYLGPVEKVSGFRNERSENWTDLTGDMNLDGLIFFKSGAVVSIQSLDAKNYNIFDIHLYGKKGAVSLEDFGYRFEFQKVARSKNYPNVFTLSPKKETLGIKRSMILSMIDNVVDCLENGTPPNSNGEGAISTLYVIDALIRSTKTGKLVKIHE